MSDRGGGREWVCAQASGDVLEIALGTGRNLPYYPSDVRLTGIELSPMMLELARKRAADLGRQVDLRLGDAQALDFADQSFDTVVCTFALCTIPDERQAVAEAYRVLRPGGRFVLVEHVRSPWLPVRAVQRILEEQRLPPGCKAAEQDQRDDDRSTRFALVTRCWCARARRCQSTGW